MLQAYAAGQTQQAEKRSALTRESGTVAAQRRGEKLAVHLKLQLDKEGAKEERIRNVLHTLQAVQVAFQHIFVGGPPTDGLEKVNQLWKAKLTGAQRLDAAHMQQEFLL